MYWWKRFDPRGVERDFACIREVGFDSVRIFTLWEDFQPEPDRISGEALANLVCVADLAEKNDLMLIITLFTGHMSGANWIPQWALDPAQKRASMRFPVISDGKIVQAGIRNWYVEEGLQEAQAHLAHEVASALGDHPAVWAWDLGNEASNCVVPPSREAGVSWLARMALEIREVGALQPITLGLHMEDLEEDRRLGPAEAAQICDFLSMHGYPSYAGWACSPIDEWILPFLGLLARWLGGKEVLFEEFGVPTVPTKGPRSRGVPLLDEEAAARYIECALNRLQHFGLLGALLWCYSDYVEALRERLPLDLAAHERSFGLWRADGSPKPALRVIRAFSDLEPKRRPPPDDYSWIDLPEDEFYKNPRENLQRLYERFRRRYAETGVEGGL